MRPMPLCAKVLTGSEGLKYALLNLDRGASFDRGQHQARCIRTMVQWRFPEHGINIPLDLLVQSLSHIH